MPSSCLLLLRDSNPAMSTAWSRHFDRLPDVEVSTGNIFDLTADAIVSPANSYGFMDGGIDLAYSRRFGWDVSKRLRELLAAEHDGELPVGQAVVVPTGDPDIPFLVSAPTMRIPMDVSDTVNAYLAFRAALRAIRAHNRGEPTIRSLLCPGLGTAVGRMPVERCARQMYAAYSIVALGFAPRFTALGSAVDTHMSLLNG